jgi:hypothetical protein
MTRLGWILAALAAIALALPAAAQPPALAVGQEWSIKSDKPTTAKVIIGRIEAGPKADEIVSVSIVDVPTEGGVTEIAHAPFAKPAMTASLDRLLASDVPIPPRFEAGYNQWKSAKGGYFTISVAQVIEIMLGMLPKPGAPAGSPS